MTWVVMKRVLIVDDVAEIRRLIRLAIGHHCVYESASAEEAQQVLSDAGGVDLLVLDIMLPGALDGLGLLAMVRAHPRWAATKVMLTARGSAEDRAASAALRADAYFTKPFSPMALNDCIDDLLSESGVGTAVAPPLHS